SVLFRDTDTGSVQLETGQHDIGTGIGPMINIVRDGNDGWGAGFRYFSLQGGDAAINRVATAPGQNFTETFNGLDWDDLVQFDTDYTSELHNAEINLRKTVRPGLTVFAG